VGNEVVNYGGEVLLEMDHCDGDWAEKAHIRDRFSPDAAVPIKAVDKVPGGQTI
jgi:hypothetical protein